MKRGSIIAVIVAVPVLLLAFYDVKFDFEFALPSERQVPDPAVEAAYRECYETIDHEIHGDAFGTIDNPDVQKEYITAHEADARQRCRERYPEETVTEHTPFSFSVVDLEPKYW